MPRSPDQAKLTVFMPRKLREAAKAKADAAGTNVSQVVRDLLTEWLAEPVPDLFAWQSTDAKTED